MCQINLRRTRIPPSSAHPVMNQTSPLASKYAGDPSKRRRIFQSAIATQARIPFQAVIDNTNTVIIVTEAGHPLKECLDFLFT